jgi:hypothetical protein
MTELPTFMKRLVQNDETDEAIEWAETPSEHLRVHAMADNRQQAREVAQSVLRSHTVTNIVREDDTLRVTCGPFTGYHSLRNEAGTWSVSEHGTYTHDPTGVQFDAECPSFSDIQAYVDSLNRAPARGDAAKAAYRSSRL